jgi:hypothetical protein
MKMEDVSEREGNYKLASSYVNDFGLWRAWLWWILGGGKCRVLDMQRTDCQM